MKLKLIAINILSILLFIACNEDTNPTSEVKLEDYVRIQTNTDWPSLAETPWPTHHHDMQSTGRSQYSGPTEGRIVDRIPATMENGGISIGYDQQVYIPQNHAFYKLLCTDYDGNTKWEIDGMNIYSTPTISRDSTIYLAGSKSFFAISHNGKIKWNYNFPKYCQQLKVVIDKQGDIYVLSNVGILNVFSPMGELKWQINDERIIDGYPVAPVFSPDGKTLYLQGLSVTIVAIDITTRKIIWTFGESFPCTAPIVDSDGNIIVIPSTGRCWSKGDVTLYSLNSKGEIYWEVDFKNYRMSPNVEPTIDYNGNIYIGVDTLYSLTNNGYIRWKKGFDEGTEIVSPLICDINNNLYVGLNSNYHAKIMSFDSEGEVLWELEDESINELGTSPAITENGILLYPNWRGLHYLIIK